MADLFRCVLIEGDRILEVARAGVRGAAQKTPFREVLPVDTGVRDTAEYGEAFPMFGQQLKVRRTCVVLLCVKKIAKLNPAI